MELKLSEILITCPRCLDTFNGNVSLDTKRETLFWRQNLETDGRQKNLKNERNQCHLSPNFPNVKLIK